MSTHSYDIDLPDGATPDCHVIVASYLNEHGESAYVLKASDGASYSTLLGLLTFAQHDLVEDRNNSIGGDS